MNSLLTESKVYDIRYSEISDGEWIKQWLKEPEVGIWYPPTTEVDQDVFVRNWIGFSKYKASLTATYEKKPIGVVTIYLMPYVKVAHVCMIYFIVSPEHLGQGVELSLLKNIRHLAKSRFRLESMHCEVFDGCGQIHALKEAGFKEIIKQERYIDFPDGPRARLIYESLL